MNIRTLVVDDELPARNRLRKFLAQEPDVEIIGECASGPEAVEDILRLHPDLVFLDVHMPQLNGLGVARALPSGSRPTFIFVTAHDLYAIEAFEVQALDYLLKPFSRERLEEAVRRARARLTASPRAGQVAVPGRRAETLPPLNRIAVKDGNQTLFVKAEDVDYIEAAGNYAVVCTARGNHVVRETLRNLEASLSPALFFRISRSIIVNVERIHAIRTGTTGGWVVVLQGDRELEMTRGIREVQDRLC
jgi:two-component system LytT family response regulator